MVFPDNGLSAFESYIAEQEQLIGLIRVNSSRSFGDGYDCGVGDATSYFQDEMNQLENERDLFENLYQDLENKLKAVSSHVGMALNKCK
jgi:hypothetical protein